MQTMDEEFYGIISTICSKDPRYYPEAYEFVMEALSFSQTKFKKSKHISGEELLVGDLLQIYFLKVMRHKAR